MEMWLKRLILVFLTGAAMTATFEDLVTLDDKNKSVKLSFGSPLNLKCNLNTSEMIRFRVSWDFIPGSSATKINVRNISSKLVNRFGKTTAMAKDNHSDHEENMLHHISSAANNNSGFYYCTVREEIPGTNTITSKKTEVVITTVSLDWWKWILLGVSAFTLIILLLVSILLRRRCRGRRVEDPIYINTRRVANKQPSPQPGLPMDNLKASSQNLQQPSPGRRYDAEKWRNR